MMLVTGCADSISRAVILFVYVDTSGKSEASGAGGEMGVRFVSNYLIIYNGFYIP
jgi:hypothetical protein